MSLITLKTKGLIQGNLFSFSMCKKATGTPRVVSKIYSMILVNIRGIKEHNRQDLVINYCKTQDNNSFHFAGDK